MIKNDEYKNYLINKNKNIDNIFYGEVTTPFILIDKMLSLIPDSIYENPNNRWLDPGAGIGNFSICLYFKLLNKLSKKIPNIDERKNHIIKSMIFMIEIQEKNINILKNIFGEDANIYWKNYLEYDSKNYDVIIGNPPFNSEGQIKVPTSNKNKKQDGKIVWPDFVIKSISLLKKETGLLCIFIPSIWLKPDKKNMYNYILQFKLEWLNCYSNTETNKIFGGKAQTPSCFFLLTKKPSDNIITIYDNNIKKYIFYEVKENKPIPIFGQEVCKKISNYDNKKLEIIKTNMPSKNVIIKNNETDIFKYKNVTTCKLNGMIPELVINYSNKPLKYSGIPKLILAHKMYGFPYLDSDGEYGISNRDNYVIIKEDVSDLIKIQKFLSTKTALYIFESTRYRMKYLEKYAFEIIPDITLLKDFPKEINDETIQKYFNFDELDIKAINSLHIKKYKFFI
tara:strand:+ start:1439 stop:2794 length:1356 start_codon:yes stop_codon:yes gene_type:complete